MTWIDVFSSSLFSHGYLVAVSLVCAVGAGARRGVVVLVDVIAGVCVGRTSFFEADLAPVHCALVAGESVKDFVWVAVFDHKECFSLLCAPFSDPATAEASPVSFVKVALPSKHAVRRVAVDGSTGLCLVATDEPVVGGQDEEQQQSNPEVWSFNCRFPERGVAGQLRIEGLAVVRALKLCDGKAYLVCGYANGFLGLVEMAVRAYSLELRESVVMESNALRLALADVGKQSRESCFFFFYLTLFHIQRRSFCQLPCRFAVTFGGTHALTLFEAPICALGLP